jgi:hypothetical protein
MSRRGRRLEEGKCKRGEEKACDGKGRRRAAGRDKACMGKISKNAGENWERDRDQGYGIDRKKIKDKGKKRGLKRKKLEVKRIRKREEI